MDKNSGMSLVISKLDKYFEDFEMGVYKEAIGEKDGAVWKVEPNDGTINYLKAMNAQGKHIFVRPAFEKEDHFMLHDDLDTKGLDCHHKQTGKWKPGRLVVETSPGNYQVWVKSDKPLTVEEKKHWLDKMDSDPGASPLHRWGRCPGFRNRKKKYETEKGYPLSKLVWIDWKDQACVPKIELPSEEIKIQKKITKTHSTATGRYKSDHISRSDYEKGDNSRTDFSYAMALLRRGFSKGEVEQRIRNERTDWKNHQGEKRMQQYLDRTIENAEQQVLKTELHNKTRGQSKDTNADYQLMIKDKKSGRKKKYSIFEVPVSNAKEVLDKYARQAIVNMGCKNFENIEVHAHRLYQKDFAIKVSVERGR